MTNRELIKELVEYPIDGKVIFYQEGGREIEVKKLELKKDAHGRYIIILW